MGVGTVYHLCVPPNRRGTPLGTLFALKERAEKERQADVAAARAAVEHAEDGLRAAEAAASQVAARRDGARAREAALADGGVTAGELATAHRYEMRMASVIGRGRQLLERWQERVVLARAAEKSANEALGRAIRERKALANHRARFETAKRRETERRVEAAVDDRGSRK